MTTSRREGPRPTTSTEGPHRQLDQKATPELWGRLVASVFSLPGTQEGRSHVSPYLFTGSLPRLSLHGQSSSSISSRAVFLVNHENERAPETSLAPGQRLEPVHLHSFDDTSVHLCLPTERGRQLTELGWLEPHQFEEFGTEYMAYGPRCNEELDVVVSLVRESIAFALGTE